MVLVTINSWLTNMIYDMAFFETREKARKYIKNKGFKYDRSCDFYIKNDDDRIIRISCLTLGKLCTLEEK